MYIGIVRKISFRYHNVLITDGFMNIFIKRTMKNIVIKIIELNNFSSNVCTFQVNSW
jgi:hypothetical protein